MVNSKIDQIRTLQNSDKKIRQPIAIIGPGDGNADECDAAYFIASHLAQAGFSIVCGGRGGVMRAASKGATEANGIAIGILPEEDLSNANEYLSLALPTGMGEMRNALIARSAHCLVSIGGNMGTISEMALGLKWDKTVFAIYEEVKLNGAHFFETKEALLEALLEWLSNAYTR